MKTIKGKDVRRIRELLGLTQSELAKKLGYRRYQTISEFENDKKQMPERFKMLLRSLFASEQARKANEG